MYQLLDPVTCEPRYVGRTRTPAIRRRGHRARRSSKPTAINDWHRRLAFHGLRPVMRILDGPIPYCDAARREEAWRRTHLEAGCELLNAVRCVDGMHEGDWTWSTESALSEVRALVRQLGLGNSYPTRQQFAANGMSGLDSAIERRLGGHRRIAAQLRLTMPTPQWTCAGAEAAVRQLVLTLGLLRYPTAAEFANAGQSGLYQAIGSRCGGHTAFARRLALRRLRNDWTSAEVDEAVSAIARATSRGNAYPTEREMRTYGPPGLADAVRHFGGNRQRAARLGLRMRRDRWTFSSASAAVLQIVQALSLETYPTQRQFRAIGMGGLHCAIQKYLGGHDTMASELALGRPRRRSR